MTDTDKLIKAVGRLAKAWDAWADAVGYDNPEFDVLLEARNELLDEAKAIKNKRVKARKKPA